MNQDDYIFNDQENDFLIMAKRIFKNVPETNIPESVDKTKPYKITFVSLGEPYSTGICDVKNKLEIQGDVYIDESLNNDWIASEAKKINPNVDPFGIKLEINGNLYVNGNISDGSVDDAMVLQVKGDVFAKRVHSVDGVINIYGDAHLQYGCYDDNNDGEFYVSGKLLAPYIVSTADYHNVVTNEGVFIHGYHGSDKEGTYVYLISKDAEIEGVYDDSDDNEQNYRLFNAGVWDEGSKFDMDTFFELIADEINPFEETKAQFPSS